MNRIGTNSDGVDFNLPSRLDLRKRKVRAVLRTLVWR